MGQTWQCTVTSCELIQSPWSHGSSPSTWAPVSAQKLAGCSATAFAGYLYLLADISYSSGLPTCSHQTTEGNQNTSAHSYCSRRMLPANPHSPGGTGALWDRHTQSVSHHTEFSLQELFVLSLTNQAKRGFCTQSPFHSVHVPMKGFLKVSALSALQFNVRDACQAEDLPALQRRAYNNTGLIFPRDYNCMSRKQTTRGSKWGAIQKDYSGIPCSRSHH